jgi:hypothetical protein
MLCGWLLDGPVFIGLELDASGFIDILSSSIIAIRERSGIAFAAGSPTGARQRMKTAAALTTSFFERSMVGLRFFDADGCDRSGLTDAREPVWWGQVI